MISLPKKVVSFLLIITVMMSCIFAGETVTVSAKGVWNGTDNNRPNDGSGSEIDPYIISDGAELAWAVTCGKNGLYFRLSSDIYLNEINEDGSLKTFNPWFRRNSGVSINIDGDGHIVYGLYYNDTSAKSWKTAGVGLVPSVSAGHKAVVTDLGIASSYVNDKYAVGGFVVYSGGVGVLDGCFLADSVTLTGFETGAFFGLSTFEFQISNCYSHATLIRGSEDSISYVGLLGDFYSTDGGNINNCTLYNCYNSSGVVATKRGLPNCGQVYATEASKLGSVLTAEQMKGAVYSGNQMLLGDAFVATEDYPILKVFAENPRNSWNGIGDNFDEGDGKSADTAYVIENAGQLAYMVATGGSGAYYKLKNDIILNDLEKINWNNGNAEVGTEYTPNSWFTGSGSDYSKYDGFTKSISFKGSFDGNGHTVYGLWYNADALHITAGLIPAVGSSTVKNLNLAFSFVSGGRFTGALSSYYAGTVSNCYIDSSVTVYGKKAIEVDSASVGGFIGWSAGISIDNCFFDGNLVDESGVGHVYGLVGTSWNTKITAENCITIGYQPFTVAMSKLQYESKEAAESFLEALDRYTVENVYTDTHKQDNNAAYALDTDGDGKYETTEYYPMFTFTELDNKSFKGLSSLECLSALSTDLWYSVEDGYPMLKKKGNADGDVNADGRFSEVDKTLLRKSLIGVGEAKNDDPNTDGISDITDLVTLCNKNGFATRLKTKTVCYELFALDLDGYIVIYPEGNELAKTAAEKLAGYFGLSALDDTAPETEKEILLGATNRPTHAWVSGLAYRSFVEKNRIHIIAEDDFALSEAVDNFIDLYDGHSIPLMRGTANGFVQDITLSNGKNYSYVWGDEFEGTVLDRTRWQNAVSGSNMGPCTAEGKDADIKVMNTPDVMKIVDGNLRLSPILYTDPDNPNIKYAVPASVRSRGRMEYRYGYAEIRAKVPFKTGVWPSYWSGESNALSGEALCDEFTVEVDVFEIFGSPNTVVPNLHKWYKSSHDPATHGCTYNGTHSTSGTDKKYYFENYENLSDEYHTYGFEWTPTEMSMYVDGYCYKTYDITKSFDACPDMTGFHDPRYIIFNNHVFSPNSKFKPNCIEGYEENLPANYDIDYFRLYQDSSVSGTAVWTKMK